MNIFNVLNCFCFCLFFFSAMAEGGVTFSDGNLKFDDDTLKGKKTKTANNLKISKQVFE